MEGINKTLFEEFDKQKGSVVIWSSMDENGLEKTKKFLELDADDYENRQKLALHIASDILEPHSKQDLPNIATGLAKLERNLKNIIEPYQRDHVCHALLTYLLGFFVISKLKCNYDFLFQWKLAGFLHDVGYPLEITDKINERFFYDYETSVLNEKYEFYPISGKNLSVFLSLYTTHISQKRNTLDL